MTGYDLSDWNERSVVERTAVVDGFRDARQQLLAGIAERVLQAADMSPTPPVLSVTEARWSMDSHGMRPEATLHVGSDSHDEQRVQAAFKTAQLAICEVKNEVSNGRPGEGHFDDRGGIFGEPFIEAATTRVAHTMLDELPLLTGRNIPRSEAFQAIWTDEHNPKYPLNRPGLDHTLRAPFHAAVVAATGSYRANHEAWQSTTG